ncbi:hypothetical protein [Cupriavidus sp. BIC8F]|nr:hypothetical protein [Cupriavidus sp. BIC8F]
MPSAGIANPISRMLDHVRRQDLVTRLRPAIEQTLSQDQVAEL